MRSIYSKRSTKCLNCVDNEPLSIT